MKKIIFAEIGMVLLLAVIMTLFLWKKNVKDIPLQDVKAHFMETMDLSGMEEAKDMRLKRSFALNAADYKEYIYFTPDNTMSVNEFLLVKCENESQIEEVKVGIDKRIAEQKQSFDGYGTDQTDLLNHAKIYVAGNYVGLFISRDADSWLDFVKKELEE